MTEYINLDEAVVDFGFEWDDIAPTREEFINFLKSRKRANVKEIVYAHWIIRDDICSCSNCKYPTYAAWNQTKYCPNCSAEMSEVAR